MLRDFIRRDAVFGGVAGGLAHSIDVPVLFVRLALFVSVFFSFGLTILFYMAAVAAFPAFEHQERFADGPKILGVCYKLSSRYGVPASWVRFFTILTAFLTAFFPVVLLYFVVHLVLNETKGQDRPFSNGNFRDVN